jgi:uncharacterized protein YceH (UPF0502 family)
MIDHLLNDQELRILGALLEKSMATPEYYPLTLNSLTSACNQKSNRAPVVAYDETTVVRAIDGLKSKQLVVQNDASRVPKYAECFVGNAKLIDREVALLCLLFLRGPQTVGELRGRSERLYAFADLAEVGEALDSLIEMEMVTKLPRQPGRKEARYSHLFTGEVEAALVEAVEARPESATLQVRAEDEKIALLESEIEVLRTELADLRQQFQNFKSQFD